MDKIYAILLHTHTGARVHPKLARGIDEAIHMTQRLNQEIVYDAQMAGASSHAIWAEPVEVEL